jgi:hypothetical protein
LNYVVILKRIPQVLNRAWSDRAFFTTRIIANLDLPYSLAAAPTPQDLTQYGVSLKDFHDAAASLDALITTGVAGAMERRPKPRLGPQSCFLLLFSERSLVFDKSIRS